MPSVQPFPSSCSILRPVNSNHGLLKKVQSLSTADIHMRTGVASAITRKRRSLSTHDPPARRRRIRLATKPATSTAWTTHMDTPAMIDHRYCCHAEGDLNQIEQPVGR